MVTGILFEQVAEEHALTVPYYPLLQKDLGASMAQASIGTINGIVTLIAR